MSSNSAEALGPQQGSKCPSFSITDAEGIKVASKDLTGRPFVLYFYPKADTSGCTKEAQEFSALMNEFSRLDIPVIAVSGDPLPALTKFRDKYQLTIRLASAQGSDILNDFAVWVEKSMYGRKYMGIERSTYLVDGDGKIAGAWRKVKVPGHAAAVLKAARGL